jgi:hypothetical protein
VINDRRITAATIKANERLLFANEISYMQAYRTIQALLIELDGDEANSFAKFPAYIERYMATHLENYADLKLSPNGNFEAVFFCPAGCRRAGAQVRPLLSLDGTHTRSKYRMQLLIAVGIDANNNGVPISWALVPIENEYWWTWFLQHLQVAVPISAGDNFLFMSDREKGLGPAVDKVYPAALHIYCCQHIADNIQSKFGIKCKSPFWACARAKTQVAFQEKLAELYKIDEKAGEYVDNIPHRYWAR